MIGWVDARVGVAGDMLLAALLDAGADLDAVNAAVAAVTHGRVKIEVRPVLRRGIAAVQLAIIGDDHERFATLAQALDRIHSAKLPAGVAATAEAVMTRLATAEAVVHGCAVDEVTLHEVGAMDTLVDVVGCISAVQQLDVSLICSPIGVGSGFVDVAHGVLSVPAPGVVELLRLAKAPSHAGPLQREAATPTGVALLAELAEQWTPQPSMTVTAVGTGAGSADPTEAANVVRILVGEATGHSPAPQTSDEPSADVVELRCNVDDLDPRVWPSVVDSLLDAGALDAWLTPITMKGGRPAVMLGVLAAPEDVPTISDIVFHETSSLGLRWQPMTRAVLERTWTQVDVGGHTIAVKLGWRDGKAITVQPEWRDVRAAAVALGRPAREIAEEARASVTHVT